MEKLFKYMSNLTIFIVLVYAGRHLLYLLNYNIEPTPNDAPLFYSVVVFGTILLFLRALKHEAKSNNDKDMEHTE